MTEPKKPFPEDKTGKERRRGLDQKKIKDLELAGGVEGGMQAGSAGGPDADDARKDDDKPEG
jgi:hypothetical protein